MLKQPKAGTQASTILDHLKRADYLTDSQASSLYGIGQCAYVVHKLRKKGFNIKSTRRPCIKYAGNTYVEYSLAA